MRLRLFRATALACALALAAPPAALAAADILPEDAPAPGAPLAASPAGQYLAGRHAETEKDLAAAADLIGEVLAANPDNLVLMHRAFLLYVGAGRAAEAEALALRLEALKPEAELVGLVQALARLKAGDAAGADARLKALPGAGVDGVLLPMLRAWLALETAGLEAAQAVLAPMAGMKGLAALYHLQAGLLNDRAGDAAAAETSYRAALAAATEPSLRMHEIVGNFYQRRGRPADARALYAGFVRQPADGAWVEPLVAALELGAGVPASVPDLEAAMAEALFDVATLLNQEQAADNALFYVRLALDLRPEFPIAQVLLADILASLGRSEEAIAAYRAVPQASPFGWQARRNVAELQNDLGQGEAAVAALRVMAAERTDRVDAALALGNILRRAERFAEAAAAYDLAVERLGDPRPDHWSIFYFRGIARERNKEWAKAEPDFLRALELQPEQPYVLNYLAYSWIELGQKYDQALDMLKRAVAARPEDGYIVDSLGWVFYRLGQHDKAVEYLERAIELKPHDPVINDHLGDAYWRVQRRDEARFQWRRALVFEPEPDQVPPIEAKIERGLQGASGI